MVEKDYNNVTSFSELLDIEYGKKGTSERIKFEEDSYNFRIAELLKETRKEARLTQEQLAIKAGTKKSYISKVENAKGNITIETLVRIFEQGLGKKVNISIS